MYGLIGYPLGHSYSANFFNQKFECEKIEETYKLFPLSHISEFKSLLKKNPSLKGLNVTIPYKETIIPYLDSLSDEAAEIGAVNVIKFMTDECGKIVLKGYNSDTIGFKESLKPLLRKDIKKGLVLGTGGASKAVCHALKELGIDVSKVSRKGSDEILRYEDLTPEVIENHLLIVNTTPVGMYPKVNEFPALPYESLTPSHICYDLIYNPQETAFMKKSKEYGATVKNGLEMLHLQALKSWEIWNE